MIITAALKPKFQSPFEVSDVLSDPEKVMEVLDNVSIPFRGF